MKYVFVINPAAGAENSEKSLLRSLEGKKDLDYEIYYTREPMDACRFVREKCESRPDEQFCFIGAGGDGTLNEIVNGLAECANGSFGCWPCGSGNDFVKYFGEVDSALDLDSLLNGELRPIDLMLINGERYSLNVIDVGFDSVAVERMQQVRRTPLLGGKNAYTTGIVHAVLTGRHHKGTIRVDGQILNQNGKFMLATVANGNYIGGGYKAAPKALLDDGLMDVCVARPLSIFRFAKLIGYYRLGEHLDNDRFSDVISYRQGRRVEIEASRPFSIVIDGELLKDDHFTIEIVEGKVRCLVPRGSSRHKKGSEN